MIELNSTLFRIDMTIRTTPDALLASRSRYLERGMLVTVAFTTLAGCSSLNSLLEPERLDYKTASKGTASSLEIPPDLTQLQRDNRYSIPESNSGTATASTYSAQRGTQPVATSATPAAVAPTVSAQARVERDGSQRWLVVNQSPEKLWPQVKDFWQDNGFLINVENQQAGVMETDWAENRAKIPQDFVRNTIGKVLDSMYSTGERDKFRTRLERRPDGSTEVYISHRGAEETLVGQQKDSTVWTPRKPDPGLEAEFLSRLMARLGVEDVKAAKVSVAQATPQASHAKQGKDANGSYVEVDEGFDRAWRRVGLALDRVGFTVEDRDRVQGIYFVRYVDQNQEAQSKPSSSKGFLSRLFSSSDDKSTALRYRVAVKEVSGNSRVTVLNGDGKPEQSATSTRILALLDEQLK